jgi:hypothetical protein
MQGVVLMGGGGSDGKVTEIVFADGSPSTPSFTIAEHQSYYCAIQVGKDSVVLTGGLGSESLVTEYTDIGLYSAKSKKFPDLNQPRFDHACGTYTVAGMQVVNHLSDP